MITKTYESEALVLEEPVSFERKNITVNDADENGKYPGLLGELLELGNRQSEMGLGITHEQFLVERELRHKLRFS